MKGFIEVHRRYDETSVLIGVSRIIKVEAIVKEGKFIGTDIDYGAYFAYPTISVKETYDEVKKLIEEATK